MKKTLNIIIPMAGRGGHFKEAGYTFPKPLIDIGGKPMIEVVVDNLRPDCDHKFIFICQKEHYDKYDLYHVLQNATNNMFEIVQIDGITDGAACTVLCATEYINNDNDLVIANSDQFIESGINDFISDARSDDKDGLIMVFEASHPKWSYARVNDSGLVVEVAEKKVISNNATVGIYYYRKGSNFIQSAQSMIKKNIRYNDEFYVAPVYNEMILADKGKIYMHKISTERMHGLGTPEDLDAFMELLRDDEISID